MSKWIVTIVLRGDRYIHAEFESEEAARSAHKELFTKLNNTLGSAQQPFAEIGNHVVRLTEVERAEVSDEDHAPGYGVGFA